MSTNTKNLEATRRFLRALWNLEDIDRPGVTLAGWFRRPYVAPPGPAVDERFHEQYLKQASVATEAAVTPDDRVPLLNSYIHIGVHASAFGSPILYEEDGEPKVLPVIRSVEEFERIGPPRDGEEANKALAFLRYLHERREDGWVVSQIDTQGPTDTASLVWDYTDMLAGGYTDPDKLHALLEAITRYTIDLAERQRAIAPELSMNHNPGLWLPPGMGISVSEDLLAVVGPDWYRQFGTPYNERLAEACGGVFVHSCGNFTHNLPVLREHGRLRGLNFNLGEVDIEPLLDALAGRTVLVPRTGLPGGLPKLRRYTEHLRANRLDAVHHVFVVDKGGDVPFEQALEMLRGIGIRTPEA